MIQGSHLQIPIAETFGVYHRNIGPRLYYQVSQVCRFFINAYWMRKMDDEILGKVQIVQENRILKNSLFTISQMHERKPLEIKTKILKVPITKIFQSVKTFKLEKSFAQSVKKNFHKQAYFVTAGTDNT